MAEADAARGQVAAALALLGSADAQLRYQREVPIAQVPYEALERWPGWLMDNAAALAGFNAEERRAILAFHDAWRSVEARPALYLGRYADQVIGTPEWDGLVVAAARVGAAIAG